MGINHSPNIVLNGLVMCLDAANIKSYPGSGSLWTDISGKGNNATLLNGPTFSPTNNGGIVFDGSTQYSHPPISLSYLNSCTMEATFNSSVYVAGAKTIFGYAQKSGYTAPTIGSMYINTGTLTASIIGVTDGYRYVTGGTILANRNYHVTFTKDTIKGILQLYVNGILMGTQTFTAANYAQWTTLGSYIGTNVLDIAKSTNTVAGQGWSTDYFNGTIYGLKVYSRVLSSSEIQQNFNALRSRYGV